MRESLPIAAPPQAKIGTNAAVISVSTQLVVIINTSTPASVIRPENIDVSELFTMASMLSISLVNRDIISPVGLESK